MRRRNSYSSFSTILAIFILIGLLRTVLGFVGILIPLISSGLFIAIIVLFVVLSIKRGTTDNSDLRSNVKLNDNGIVEALKSIEDNKIQINNGSYLFLRDMDNINLDTIDLYLNDECIGTLSEFGKYQPRAFNSLCKNLAKKLNIQSKSDKLKDKITESIVIEKNCSYYINKLNNTNNQIETKEINDLVNQTIKHLKEIKRIEDEFGDKQDKTRKLYDYYLPMYLDILTNYDRLHDNAPQSEDYKKSEEKVLKTGALINNALSNLSDSLVENYRTSLNVDMKTLESILKKDGLISDISETKVS